MEQTLGKRIAANRKRLGMTQDRLAELLGVTAQAVSKWENDQSCPDITMLPRLSEIFGVSTDELLGNPSRQTVHEAEVVEDEGEREDNGVRLNHGSWDFRWESGKRDAITFAALVLLVGVLTLVSRAFHLDVSFWGILWPSVLLVYGLRGVFRRLSFFSIGCSLFGAYFLAGQFGLVSRSIGGELLFPIIIVIFGLSLLVDAMRKPSKPRFKINNRGSNSGKTSAHFRENGEHFDCSVTFGESDRTITLPRVSSGQATVSFGEMKVDLTQCGEIVDGCHISLRCSFGELILLVPKAYRVESDPSNSFGNTEISGQPDMDAEKTIFVDSSVSFGEISICYI